MKIQKKLEELLQYYMSTRNIGHTTLLKEGSKHYNKEFFVLSLHIKDCGYLELKPQQVISLENLDKLRGHDKPLIIDNGAMIELLGDALMKIEGLKEENKKLLKDKKKIYITKNDKT